MTNSQRMWRTGAAAVLAAIVCVATPVNAQVFTGRIDVTVRTAPAPCCPA